MASGLDSVASYSSLFLQWCDTSWSSGVLRRIVVASCVLSCWTCVVLLLLSRVKLKPSAHVWIWRCIHLKLLLILIGVPSISLSLVHLPTVTLKGPKVLHSTRTWNTSPSPSQKSAQIASKSSVESTLQRHSLGGWWWMWLLWGLFCLGMFARWCIAWSCSRLFRRRATKVDLESPAGKLYAQLCSSYVFSERWIPQLMLSKDVSTPVCTGCLHPAILFPVQLWDVTSQEQKRLILAHELAHVKRADLWWALLPTLLECMLFFHPLFWFSRHQWNIQQEMAADQLALCHTGASLRSYGQVLLDFSTLHITSQMEPSLAFGRQRSICALRKRIEAMSHYNRPSSRISLWMKGSTLCFLVVAIGLPWSVFATPKNTPKVSAKRTHKSRTSSVSVMFFHDFQCPFCTRSALKMEKLRKEYKGKVRFVLKHYPLTFHKHAYLAAQATLAAKAQGKMWAYYNILNKNSEKLQLNELIGYARQLKLDIPRFRRALAQKKYTKEVDADRRLAKTLGVRGIPSFFINGVKVEGVRSLQTMRSHIRRELHRYTGQKCGCKDSTRCRCKN